MGKQTKIGNSVDKGGGKRKRKEKGREGEKRTGKRNKEGVPLIFKIYRNRTVGFHRSKN